MVPVTVRLSLGVEMSRFALLITCLAITTPAFAKDPFRQDSIVLLQPGSLLEKRVSVEDLSSYIKRLNEIATRQAADFTDRVARSGSIVFAVRPDGSRKVWLDVKPAFSDADAGSMVAALEAATPCAVRDGTVVAAINVSFWGGKARNMGMPMPDEWRTAITGDGVEVTQLVDSIWPQGSTPGTSLERARER